LRKRGADWISHGRRTLLDHLLGTHSLLNSWQQREAVCDAGLFHSVYGTEHFANVTISEADRDEVRALIGTEAEELSWLFGILERDSFDENLSKVADYSVRHRTSGARLPLSARQWSDLIVVTFANTLEAMPHIGFFVRRRCRGYLKRFGKVAPAEAVLALQNS
jgi:hypothetical protein